MNWSPSSVFSLILLSAVVFYFAVVRREKRGTMRSLLESVLREVPLERDASEIADNPLDGFVVVISGQIVTCHYPDGRVAIADFDKVDGVDLVTTDQGPILPDVFWVLIEGPQEVYFPWGAANESALSQKVRQLPGLDWDAMVEASHSTRTARFVCWRRGQNLNSEAQNNKPERTE